ncbi:MAG: alpha/beta fold hydrolase [Candidatus Omnitrophica bacterium]|nr:alpha/beta fold hydrolase [Candidatus Omnitrophota bacterium]
MFKTNKTVFFSICIVVFSLHPSHGWEGFKWEEWRSLTHAEKPPVVTPQSGRADLFPLLQKDAPDGEEIQSIEEWESKRDRILETLEVLIGNPAPIKRVPPYAEIFLEENLGDHTRIHMRIASEPDDWIPAYLLIPNPVPARPAPAMIVLHQTVAQGKDEPCGVEGNSELALALELVREGFVCIAPDAIGFGERTPPGAPPYHDALRFYRDHPDWSFWGKMAWDVRRIVDYLETLSFIDNYRIGCIGHSHGGYGTLFAAIFEPRISAAAVSCGFTTLRKDPTPERWSHLTALMPKLGFYVDSIEEAPFDWHEIIACIAPRPFFLWSTLNDSVFPATDNFPEIFEQVKDVYALYGASVYFHPILEEGPHSFPQKRRREAYDWLQIYLSARPDSFNMPASLDEWESDRKQIKKLLSRDIGPTDPPSLESAFQILSATSREGCVEKKIQYAAAPGEYVSAYLFYPDAIQKTNPGIVVFHQTTEYGKEEPAGRKGRKSMHLGLELAGRGYIVLAPDSITAGERIDGGGPFDTRQFYRRHPNASALGKMIQDGRRAVDILQTIPEVNPKRIGVIGHSLGAEEALFVAAFDERVQAAAASCGFAPLRAESNPWRWARDHWFSYMPRLRIDLRAGRPPAWDFDDAIRLIAPRGYFNFQTMDDEIFPEGYASHAMTLSLRPLWRMYGKANNLRSLLEPGPHDFSPSAKAAIYSWFDSILFDTEKTSGDH